MKRCWASSDREIANLRDAEIIGNMATSKKSKAKLAAE